MTTSLRTLTAAALVAASALVAAPAQAGRVIWSVGIGTPGVVVGASSGYHGYGWSTGYYAPAPVYYAPAPVYYGPAVPFYGSIYYNNWRPRHHRHWAPPPPRHRHFGPPPGGRHPGARPVHQGRPGGHMRPPPGRR